MNQGRHRGAAHQVQDPVPAQQGLAHVDGARPAAHSGIHHLGQADRQAAAGRRAGKTCTC